MMIEELNNQSDAFEDVPLKLIEVARPEHILDAQTKTAMLTVATWADLYRVGETWHNLQMWRTWEHGKRVNEVSHFGAYTTMQGDLLGVCPLDSDEMLCQVQVVEIRMVDCEQLTSREIRELGYDSWEEYAYYWGDMAESPKGWFMRIMLVSDSAAMIH